jgi:hypothetical protein
MGYAGKKVKRVAKADLPFNHVTFSLCSSSWSSPQSVIVSTKHFDRALQRQVEASED